MTSYLIYKLEALKEDENKLKEQQRVLQEEIELEIEKKRRLELDGTIIKLRTQVGELAKNIEGKIMPDNRMLVLKFGKHNYTHEEQREIRNQTRKNQPPFLTLEKFKDNLSKMDEWVNNIPMDQRHRILQNEWKHLEIPQKIKIYDDIIPIFTTMIGIMKKQEFEIAALKSKLEILIDED
uniref:Uncharacterized protein n=1 Tax=viral metagenome TaxID=1070528 RepID=A0A6C0EN23_9ZZZZ